jgi:hypothetical protein
MKIILYSVALILTLSGIIFFLQGLRLLPSAVMYGKPEWVVIGAGMVIVGTALIFLQRRAKN